MTDLPEPGRPPANPSPGPGPPEGRIRRSWRLLSASWALLRRDRSLLLIAAAGFAAGVAGLAIVFLLVTGGHLGHRSQGRMVLVGLIGAYPLTFIATFFNVALLSAAQTVLDGGQASAGAAFRVALSKIRQIALWSLLAAGVGVLLEQIASRLPLGGRLVTWLAGAAWSVVTLVAVPVLVVEGCGATHCVKRSATLIRGRWGEGIAGRVSITACVMLVAIPAAMAVGFGLALTRRGSAAGVPLIAAGVALFLATMIVASAATQIFGLALYRYASDGRLVDGFTEEDMSSAFKRRRGR